MHRLRLIPKHAVSTRSISSLGERTIYTSVRTHRRIQGADPVYQLHGRRSMSGCPSCSATLTTALPTCNKCGYIAPVPAALKSDYFALFGLPSLLATKEASEKELYPRNVFNVDPQELKNRFLHLQKLCHPDRWAQKSQASLELFMEA